MPDLNEIYVRFLAVLQIGAGRSDRLAGLDISYAGFRRSFFALVVAFVPMLLSWIIQARIIHAYGGPSMAGVLVWLALVSYCQWLLPLYAMLIAERFLKLGTRFVVFVIAYNWLKAVIEWCYAPFYVLELLLPEAYGLYTLIAPLLLFFVVLLTYRVFQAALGQPASFMVPFVVIYFLLSGLITILFLLLL